VPFLPFHFYWLDGTSELQWIFGWKITFPPPYIHLFLWDSLESSEYLVFWSKWPKMLNMASSVSPHSVLLLCSKTFDAFQWVSTLGCHISYKPDLLTPNMLYSCRLLGKTYVVYNFKLAALVVEDCWTIKHHWSKEI
jgi:hypothetical protein